MPDNIDKNTDVSYYESVLKFIVTTSRMKVGEVAADGKSYSIGLIPSTDTKLGKDVMMMVGVRNKEDTDNMEVRLLAVLVAPEDGEGRYIPKGYTDGNEPQWSNDGGKAMNVEFKPEPNKPSISIEGPDSFPI